MVGHLQEPTRILTFQRLVQRSRKLDIPTETEPGRVLDGDDESGQERVTLRTTNNQRKTGGDVFDSVGEVVLNPQEYRPQR